MDKIARIEVLEKRRDAMLAITNGFFDLSAVSYDRKKYGDEANHYYLMAKDLDESIKALKDLKSVCDKVQAEHGSGFKLKKEKPGD